jgi:TetR/AcrR family transcriptional repressor of mexJK operon
VATRRGRPTQAEAKKLDQTIREAAVATFAEFGYADTSMEAIARAAGVTRRSLYARYPDKRAVFVDVIPWAMTKFDGGKSIEAIIGDDLEATLLSVARACLARAVRPETLRLKRMALSEAACFPEFNVSSESMMWAGRQRVVTEVLKHYADEGRLDLGDVELAAEHFLAMVEAVPARMADFGVFRSKAQQERHLQYAVGLFLRGTLPR